MYSCTVEVHTHFELYMLPAENFRYVPNLFPIGGTSIREYAIEMYDSFSEFHDSFFIYFSLFAFEFVR